MASKRESDSSIIRMRTNICCPSFLTLLGGPGGSIKAHSARVNRDTLLRQGPPWLPHAGCRRNGSHQDHDQQPPRST